MKVDSNLDTLKEEKVSGINCCGRNLTALRKSLSRVNLVSDLFKHFILASFNFFEKILTFSHIFCLLLN